MQKKSKFFRRFYPTYMYERVEHIPYELIERNNIKLIILDMDNTLIDNNKIYKKELKNWVKDMKVHSVKLCILSNSPFEEKVKKIARELKVEYEFNAKKPLLGGFKKILEHTNIKTDNILMIGDQIFTDVWGGNRIGVRTVLVTPINKKESILSKVKRPLEKVILKKYLSEGEKI